MWEQDYLPVADSLAWSAFAASLPIVVLLILIGILRKPAWIAGLAGLGTGLLVAIVAYDMPAGQAVSASLYGAAFGLFPIGWIVYWAIVLYRLTLETGKFEVIKDSIGGLTSDRRLQAMLIAFAFGAFIEGSAGFGTPVAVAAAMLTGLGFSPFYAAALCLLANTAPVAFGSIGIPVVTLADVTGIELQTLSSWVGRLCAPVAFFIPGYLVWVMGGFRALKGVLPAALVCGGVFASVQFLVSNYIGPHLVDIMASVAAIVGLVVLFKFWQPSDEFHLEGESDAVIDIRKHSFGTTLLAWSPYLFLVLFVLVWGSPTTAEWLNRVTFQLPWPALHDQVIRVAPAVESAAPYPALFRVNWLSAAGTACAFATVAAAFALRVSPLRYVKLLGAVAVQLFFSLLTIAAVLGLAYLMNYSGAAVTLGIAFAATGVLFPYFSAMLGWLGVFLSGSDTAANALFGNLQVVTSNQLGFDPAVMASANSAGGVMGKMISLGSLAVAVAATGMSRSQEGQLFRFTFRHSVFLGSVVGLLTLFYAYAL